MSAADKLAESINWISDSMRSEENVVANAIYSLKGVLAPDTALGRRMSIAGSLERIADGLFAIAEAIAETRAAEAPKPETPAAPVVGWNGASKTVTTARNGYTRSPR